ncbi:DUF6049 family protein [Streptomyces sp. HNM0663]|uniref:DUF6049 family protein n=1 Tax=Streptomyces chengmaiensis TaxID=3040919 RepID=A0ABT6HHH1_9ACTN|nr:DUF6049 family protein [Streptomyces chengmaiensis]MDH2388214.1 DUF6049 family protein [Streptomyces chengmaiensis]
MAEAADFQGMNTSPARRRLRRTASLIFGAPLLAGLVCGPAASTAHAAERAITAEDATGSRTVDVSLTTMTPVAPEKDDTITISGTLVNKGKQTITEPELDLRVGQRLTSRSSIDRASERTGYAPGLDGPPVGGKYTLKIPQLVPGISRDFTLSVLADELDLSDDGVYQLGVSLSGRTADTRYERVLGIERTFLPWQPEAMEKKTQLTYLWPLISSTHLTSESGSDEQQTPVFENESLAAELAPGGRLDQLVTLGDDLPVTWVIDPDLLATVDAMTRNYEVKSGDSTVKGKHQAVAKRWLTALEAAVQESKVIALPFADPDLASLAHRGKNVSGSLSHLQPATEVAETTVETILHVKPSVDFAWPVDGAIDSSIVDVATSGGAHKVLARSDSLRDTLDYTPTAARPIGGGTTAVVTDARLSTAFEGDMVRADSSALAVQTFAAQSLAVSLERPEDQRSIVVAPQRMPTAAQAQSMSRALHALDGRRWTQPQDLTAAAAAKPDPDAHTIVPGSSQYPSELRKQELPVKAFQDIRATQTVLDSFKVILTAPHRVVTPFGRAIDREMSTSWRGQGAAALSYRTAVSDNLVGLTEEVRLIEKSDVTLSGRSATIPVTVQNKLLQGVDHLVLRLRSESATRLNLDDDNPIAEQPIVVDGGHSQSVKFDANANANGPVQMTAQLYTADGKPYGLPMTFTVKVSEITPTVMLVIAGGVLLLVLAGVRMYTQRKRAAARESAAEADSFGEAEDAKRAENTTAVPTGGADGGDGSDPEQPSDPTPDTGTESGDPSGAGEKVDR